MSRTASGTVLIALLIVACSSGDSSQPQPSSESTCEQLAACCETLSEGELSLCQQALEQASGDEAACGASLDELRLAGTCGGESSQGGSGGSGGSSGSAGEGQGGGAPPVCTSGLPDRFAPGPAAWALPAGRCGASFDRLAGSGALTYGILNLSDDRVPELLVYSDDCDEEVGRDHWDLYSGSDNGFEAAPRPVKIPAPRCGEQFDGPEGNGAMTWSLLDVDGDRLPEIVVTRDTCDGEIGTDRWDLYRFDGEHFGQAPSSFQLPASRCGVSYNQLGSTSDIAYAVLDLTGDGKVDLVVTGDYCDADVGIKHWDVYAGTGSGFDKVPSSYGLPARPCGDAWKRVSQAGGEVRYSLLDMTADGRPDLVVFLDACDADVGRKRWEVYAGGDTAFAGQPTAYGLPAPRCGGEWRWLAANNPVNFSLLDVTCDARPDLVITREDCDGELGVKRWDVHEGQAASFSAAPSSIELPAGRCGGKFEATAASGAMAFTAVELRGKGRPELVVTRDDCDTDIGKQRWDVYGLE